MSQLHTIIPLQTTVRNTRDLFKRYKKHIRFCYVCHKSFKSLKDKVVHHIDGTGDWENNQPSNNREDNMVVLHRSCHMRLHWTIAKEQGRTNLFQPPGRL